MTTDDVTYRTNCRYRIELMKHSKDQMIVFDDYIPTDRTTAADLNQAGKETHWFGVMTSFEDDVPGDAMNARVGLTITSLPDGGHSVETYPIKKVDRSYGSEPSYVIIPVFPLACLIKFDDIDEIHIKKIESHLINPYEEYPIIRDWREIKATEYQLSKTL